MKNPFSSTTMEMEETSTNEEEAAGATTRDEETEGVVDLISELPDSLLHHILSFLDMTYVFQTSFLSRRWRYVWTSVPILNFDYKVYNHCLLHSKSSCVGVHNFVDRLLYVRDQKSHIQAFRVLATQDLLSDQWSMWFDSAILRQVYTWIHLLVRQNVKELDIQLEIMENCMSHIIRFPNCLFTCQSLTTLTLGVIGGSSTQKVRFNLPDDDDGDSVIMSLPALKTLHLKSFTYCTRKKSTRNFFSSVCCPVLETLIISCCRVENDLEEELTISALQLKNLIIIDEYSGYPCAYDEYSRIKVFAPKLRSFRCRDNKLNDYSFVDISSLMNAEIDTVYGSHYYGNYYWGWRKTDHEKITIAVKKRYIQNVLKCLRAIRNVKSLVLSTWLLEDVYNFHNEGEHVEKKKKVHMIYLGSILKEFWNLSFLKLRTSFSRDHYGVIKYLLEKCPNIETLVFERTKPPESIDQEKFQEDECPEPKEVECSKPKKDESWNESLRWQCKLHHLKVVEIQNVIGSLDELKFLQFLLMDAVVLEKMVVYTSGMKKLAKKRKTFMKELLKSPRASSRTEISFI